LSTHPKIKQTITEKETKKEEKSSVSDASKEPKASSKVSKTKKIKIAEEQKKNKKEYQSEEKPAILDKGEKINDNNVQRERQKVQPVEPWRLGESHNKIQFHKHHAADTEQ
jgi:preprotein translocase subunit SecD